MSNSLVAAAAPSLDGRLADRAHAILEGSAAPPPIASLIGFRPVALAPGHAVFELDTDLDRQANPMGTLHGGILCDLADRAMGFAYASTLADGESFTTLELKIFLKASCARSGRPASGLLATSCSAARRSAWWNATSPMHGGDWSPGHPAPA
jgi:hypothetical protein